MVKRQSLQLQLPRLLVGVRMTDMRLLQMSRSKSRQGNWHGGGQDTESKCHIYQLCRIHKAPPALLCPGSLCRWEMCSVSILIFFLKLSQLTCVPQVSLSRWCAQ